VRARREQSRLGWRASGVPRMSTISP
jgi:hypothetical protein